MEDLNEDNSLTSDVFVDVVVVVAQFPYYLLLTSACYAGLRYYQLWVVIGALTKGSLSNDVGDSGENAK